MEYAVIEKKNPVMILFLILAILTLSTGILIRLSTTDQPTDAPPQIHDETDINWAAPPCNPDNLSVDWKEITDARMLKIVAVEFFNTGIPNGKLHLIKEIAVCPVSKVEIIGIATILFRRMRTIFI